MGYHGASMFSYVILLIGTAAVIFSIATQHWSEHTGLNVGTALSAGGTHRGLIQTCMDATSVLGSKVAGPQCKDRYSDLWSEVEENAKKLINDDEFYITGDVEVWEFTVLVLMCASALFGVLALLVGPCCCNRCGMCLGFYVLFSAIFSAVGVGLHAYKLFGGDAIDSMITQAQNEVNDKDTMGNHFGYSFYCAMGGSVLQIIAALLFCVGGRQSSHEYTQHI